MEPSFDRKQFFSTLVREEMGLLLDSIFSWDPHLIWCTERIFCTPFVLSSLCKINTLVIFGSRFAKGDNFSKQEIVCLVFGIIKKGVTTVWNNYLHRWANYFLLLFWCPISDNKCRLLFIIFFEHYQLERNLYVKLKAWESNSIDPDETAHYEPAHLDLCCLQKPIIIAYGSERVKFLQSY